MSLCNNWSFFFFFKKRKDSYLLLSSDGIFVLTETVWSNTHSSVLWSISNPHVGGKVAARSYRTRFHDKSCQSNKVCQSLIPATTDIFSYWSKKRKSRIGLLRCMLFQTVVWGRMRIWGICFCSTHQMGEGEQVLWFFIVCLVCRGCVWYTEMKL